MLTVSGKPLLQWIIQWLKQNGVINIVIGVAYQKEKIIDYFGNGEEFGVKINYSHHTVEGGTSEGFRFAIERYVTDETFVAMNGDELVDIRIPELVKFHQKTGGVATIALGPLRSPYGVVDIEGDDVIGFQEKPIIYSNYVSIGIYVFSHEILSFLPEKGDVERICFPKLASQRKLKAYLHRGFWATINTLKDLEEAENQLARS